MLATDSDKLLHGGDRIVETLKGADATRAKLEAALAKVAAQAKPSDAFVLMMIGHGTFDGTEYKFNLPGPDISATELAVLLNRIPATRQLVVDMTSASGGADRGPQEGQPHHHHRDQIRHGKERHRLRALLGGSPARSRGRCRQERNHLGARGLPVRRKEDRPVLLRGQASRHRASAAGRSAARRIVSRSSNSARPRPK